MSSIISLLNYQITEARTIAPPDRRTWDEVAHDCTSKDAQHANDGQYDGKRLKELDADRAVNFLLPFLQEDQPSGLRVKAIGALGWSSFHEAIPLLSAIALDDMEDDKIRQQALNPGLRYMNHRDAVSTAKSLVYDDSYGIRISSYWVLSGNGTDAAVSILQECISSKNTDNLRDLIFALINSKHPRAGEIIFKNCTFDTIM